MEVIDDWLRDDLDAPRKQRHTAKRIFDRLLDEHDAVGVVSYWMVREYVATRRIEVLMLHRHLRHDQVVTGLSAALNAGALTADGVALEARKHDEVSDDPGTEPRAEPTEPPGRQAVRSLTERRLRAQLPADDRPLPTVDKNAKAHRPVCASRNSTATSPPAPSPASGAPRIPNWRRDTTRHERGRASVGSAGPDFTS
ncbi:hypothetical protein AB0J63_17495 [Streptosporangium canum]|uniref:hypothetical protein n=1 Tax=Streptosporangium canum TaxID=324952 RepID=UPI0034448F97